MGHTFVIKSIVSNPDGTQTLTTDNTYYLTERKRFSIGTDQYKVKSFVFNESITVEKVGDAPNITIQSFDLPAPYYKFGTVTSTNIEVTQLYKSVSEVDRPLVFLLNPIVETEFYGGDREGQRDAPLVLFFIDFSNYEDNLNVDFSELAIKPLSNVDCKLIELIQDGKAGCIGTLVNNSRRINHLRFAREDKNGEIMGIFSQSFSAIQRQLTLQIKNC